MMPDSTSLVRHWRILRMMSSRRYGVTVDELVAEFQVAERTIRRDLAQLKAVGFALSETVGDHNRKFWKLDPRQVVTLAYTFDEALALYLGRRLLQSLAGTMLWEASERAFDKIRSSLPERSLQYLERMAGAVLPTSLSDARYSSRRELIDCLLQGIEEKKVAFLSYQSQRATEPVSYEIEPLGLILHWNGSLYLVASSREHAEIRHFKVDRMDSVDLQPFPPPAAGGLRSGVASGGFLRRVSRRRSARDGACSF